MSDEKNSISRRRALKVITVGAGTVGALSLLDKSALGQDHQHNHNMGAMTAAKPQGPQPLRFFNPGEIALITTISDIIIPTDEHSPGAKAAEVPAFIDLMVSESPTETKSLWRDGLAAVNQMSQRMFSADFNSASPANQVKLLTEISKNEFAPKTLEERFFRAIKSLTIDGYYTSEIGIHKDLQYKGNTYVKNFVGCTHPEHMS